MVCARIVYAQMVCGYRADDLLVFGQLAFDRRTCDLKTCDRIVCSRKACGPLAAGQRAHAARVDHPVACGPAASFPRIWGPPICAPTACSPMACRPVADARITHAHRSGSRKRIGVRKVCAQRDCALTVAPRNCDRRICVRKTYVQRTCAPGISARCVRRIYGRTACDRNYGLLGGHAHRPAVRAFPAALCAGAMACAAAPLPGGEPVSMAGGCGALSWPRLSTKWLAETETSMPMKLPPPAAAVPSSAVARGR